MNWSLFNPFQKFFCVLSMILLSSQGFIVYNQYYNKKIVNVSCPQIPEFPAIPKPKKVDLSGIMKMSVTLDKSNKKLDLILRQQKKVDKILKTMDSWSIDR